uniref:DUF3715 domain-containing protein n=1 Tax=Denticeps clupeoides TaxID=299321 RepID=A0AAY4EFM9_9TELE
SRPSPRGAALSFTVAGLQAESAGDADLRGPPPVTPTPLLLKSPATRGSRRGLKRVRPVRGVPRHSYFVGCSVAHRLFQPLPPESREFEDLVKLVSSLYLEASSRGAFTYTKAHLIHSELLEKEFVEKKRELKQAGRTDAELAETYAFLLPEKDKVRSICEKGLAVGHARISMLGNPSKGVYLAKYSDLLQMNPFEVGATGDIVVFRMMKGRVKSIHEHTPKNTLDPTPKFDCHVSKNASKVTSLLSYRAFEHTQQFFYEFAFEELRSRPRHVCPYAVLSFQYKGKESGPVANSCPTLEAKRVRRRYTVWSGMLLNKGEELFQISVRSSTLPFLPFRLPEKLDINLAMQLDQVKRKIPSVLFSWDTYSSGREVLKCGMYCSLFEVVSKSKTGNCLSGLIQKLERDRMVLVKPLMDKGFLFLLSSSQMHTSKGNKGVQALFIFQEPRLVTRCCNFFFLSNLSCDVVSGVEHQAMDYLNRRERTSGNLSHLAEYRQNLDDRGNISTSPRVKPNMDLLRSYIYGSSSYQLPGSRVQSMVEGGQAPSPAGAEEYSPMSDWGGSDRQPSGSAPQVQQSNGGGQRARPSQGGEYDKDKMEKLLRLIQLHKKALVKDGLAEAGHDGRVNEGWDTSGLKRKLVDDEMASVSKSLRTELLINGDPGICDTDLRERMGPTSSVSETHRLLKLLMATLNRAVAKRATDLADQMPETLSSEPDRDASDIDLRKKVAEELQATQDYLEVGAGPEHVNHDQGPSTLKEAGKKSEKPASEEPGATSTAEQSPSQAGSSHPVSAPPSETAPPIPTSSVANSIIGQIKPDIFLSLVEMVQKNTLKFYIHDEVESELCAEIKGYLKSLGNTECNPQSFLENSNSMDKFLVIIQNEYIAAHVHKIPALVTLKKLPSVSFAGVDSLDDVKNRTYNELFVSGGLIVSDEHILSPDSMTLEKLQKFLTLLEEQSSTWQWKVHCKTQKKLKELSRINSDAMSLLTLLTAYQKKHLVEFLPYHECDAPSRHAPDLDCLVKLQAHHTHQRHIILLTGELSFSRHGIVIASIDDIMNSFSSLIGISSRDKLPTAPSAGKWDLKARPSTTGDAQHSDSVWRQCFVYTCFVYIAPNIKCWL